MKMLSKHGGLRDSALLASGQSGVRNTPHPDKQSQIAGNLENEHRNILQLITSKFKNGRFAIRDPAGPEAVINSQSESTNNKSVTSRLYELASTSYHDKNSDWSAKDSEMEADWTKRNHTKISDWMMKSSKESSKLDVKDKECDRIADEEVESDWIENEEVESYLALQTVKDGKVYKDENGEVLFSVP